MAVEYLMPEYGMYGVLSRLTGVQGALRVKSQEMATTGAALLAPHTKTGNAHVIAQAHSDGVAYGDIDHFVVLVDEPRGRLRGDALAIEEGHINSGKYSHLAPRRVGGLHILKRTIEAHRR